MYIGILNRPESGLKQTYGIDYFSPSQGKKEIPTEGQNPFVGETLKVNGLELMGQPLKFTWDPGQLVFIDRIVLHLGDMAFEKIEVRAERKTANTYTAESGKTSRERKVEIPVLSSGIVPFEILIYAQLADIAVEGIDIFGCIADSTLTVYPEAADVARKKGFLNSEKLSGISYPEEYRDIAEQLSEALNGEYGALTELSEEKNCSVSLSVDKNIPADGFKLRVTYQKLTLKASNRRGFMMGIHRLEAMASLVSSSMGVPCCEIEDAPFMPFRGVHLYLPGPEEIEFTKRLIRYCISPVGYNYIIFEFAGGMYYESHPEITEAVIKAKQAAKEGKLPPFPHGGPGGDTALTHDQVRELVQYARSLGIEVIPEIQSLSHVQYMTWAHPEIAEIPEGGNAYTVDDPRLADVPPSEVYKHSYCPSCEESYRITLDLLEEIINVVQPTEYVHMGHDEVYQIGLCPLCKKKDPAELFYSDVMRYYNFIKAKGLKTVIWADMVQPASKYATRPALDMLPKDIILMDFIWYFHPDKDIEDGLLERGFNVVYGNMYSSYFGRYENRIRKPGIIGGQVSAWTRTTEEILGREGKIYDILYTGNQLWSDKYISECRYCYDMCIRILMPKIRQQLAGLPGTDEEEYLEEEIAPDDEIWERGKADINRKLDYLRIVHNVDLPYYRTPWVDVPKICEYTVHYTDGTTALIPIKIGMQVGSNDRMQNAPLWDKYYRHNGYTATYFCDSESYMENGKIETYYIYDWRNPCPEKKVKKLTYEPCSPLAEFYFAVSIKTFKKKKPSKG